MQANPINLITPPASPVQLRNDDDEREEKAGVQIVRSEEAGPTKRAASDETMDDDDNDVVEVTNVEPKRMRLDNADAQGEDDDDVVFTGYAGDIATFSMPHHSSMCGHRHKPFRSCSKAEASDVCPQCYCYVCDKPVAECFDWDKHCFAHPDDPTWRAERQAIKTSRPNALASFRGTEILGRLVCVRDAAMDVPLRSGKLHICQKQTLAWTHDIEVNGIDLSSLANADQSSSLIHSGIIADEMGMGKSVVIIALIVQRPMLTLIVTPPEIVLQWKTAIESFSHLRIEVLYGKTQTQARERVVNGEVDVIVVGAGSKLDSEIWTHVKRLVLDEGHKLFQTPCEFSGEVMTKVRNISDTIKHKWILSGTPWVSYLDPIVLRYFKLLGNPNFSPTKGTLDDLRSVVIRHTMNQRVTHENGVVGVAVSVPVVKHRQLHTKLTPEETRLYEIAGCIDNASCQRALNRYVLFEAFETRLMIANGFFDAFSKRLSDFYLSSTIPIGKTHEWIETACDILAESKGLLATIANGNVGKFRCILDDMKEQQAMDSRFKAIIVTQSTEAIGTWMKRWSTMSVIVAPTSKGTNKFRIQRAMEEFQTGRHDILVCPIALAEVGANLQMGKALYFVDPDLNTTRYDQTIGRIRRTGVIHSELHAVMVVVDDTVHEAIHSYMMQSDKDDMNLFCKHLLAEVETDPNGVETAKRVPTNEELKSTPAFLLKALPSMDEVVVSWDMCPVGIDWDSETRWESQSVFVCKFLGSLSVRTIGSSVASQSSLPRDSDFFGNIRGPGDDDDIAPVLTANELELAPRQECVLNIPAPINANEIATIVVHTVDGRRLSFQASSGVPHPVKKNITTYVTYTPPASAAASSVMLPSLAPPLLTSAPPPTDEATGGKERQLVKMSRISVCLQSNPHTPSAYLFERTFLKLRMKECKLSLRRAIIDAHFVAVCSKGCPWWIEKARCTMKNNILTVHACPMNPLSKTYWETDKVVCVSGVTDDSALRVWMPTRAMERPKTPTNVDAIKHLADLDANVTTKWSQHVNTPLAWADRYYEEYCLEDYAKICVQLEAPAPVGTRVSFLVFDNRFTCRVRCDVDDAGMFHCRIPSQMANNQGRRSTNGVLLTEDAWVLYDKVSIRANYPYPNVRLRIKNQPNL